MSATFLRELAEVIDDDGDCRRLDGEDVTRLRTAANHVEALEREIQRRANAQLELVANKERLIYHVLSVLMRGQDARSGSEPERRQRALRCLVDLDCAWGTDRARRMLKLGEPGRRISPNSDGSPLPLFMREAVTDLVEDLVDGVARRRDATAKLHEALVTIVSVIGGRPEGDEIDRYAGWASVVASNVLQGEPYPATPRAEQQSPTSLPVPHQICSLQDFVDLCGEGDPLFPIVSQWFAAGGRTLEAHLPCPDCHRRPPLCECGRYERGC